MPWWREWQPTPVFLPGKSHGQRSLVGYSPWDRKESDTTEQLTLSLYITRICYIHIGACVCVCVCVCVYVLVCVCVVLSHVRLSATPWTGAHQAPLSTESSRQEYWRCILSYFRESSSPTDQTHISCISYMACEFFTTVSPGQPIIKYSYYQIWVSFSTVHVLPIESEKRGRSVVSDSLRPHGL